MKKGHYSQKYCSQTVRLRLFGHNLTDCATLCSNLS